jgi:hypothetical protein
VLLVTELVSIGSEKVIEILDVIGTEVTPSVGVIDTNVGDVVSVVVVLSLSVVVLSLSVVVLSVLFVPSSLLLQEMMMRLKQ